MKQFKILGFAGSLREMSFNRALLRAAKKILPENLDLEIFELKGMPLYNDDLAKTDIPPMVQEFREKITAADGLLIAAPEHNYSISGVLKTALDWAATNTINNILSGKTIALMGASKGIFGTARSQLNVRQALFAANAHVINRPQIYVRNAGNLMDEDGDLVDQDTIDRIRELLDALAKEISAV